MAETDATSPLQADPDLGAADRAAELEQARRLAERYRLEFIDMVTFRIDQELFRSIPADLMLRYGFVPYKREGADGKTLRIVVSDPRDLPMIDELELIPGGQAPGFDLFGDVVHRHELGLGIDRLGTVSWLFGHQITHH